MPSASSNAKRMRLSRLRETLAGLGAVVVSAWSACWLVLALGGVLVSTGSIHEVAFFVVGWCAFMIAGFMAARFRRSGTREVSHYMSLASFVPFVSAGVARNVVALLTWDSGFLDYGPMLPLLALAGLAMPVAWALFVKIRATSSA